MAAIRSGMLAAGGDYFVVMAADLQEPPDLVLRFFGKLADASKDVVVGCRESREDPLGSRLASNVFWRLYKKFVIHEIPENGVDVFGCMSDSVFSFTDLPVRILPLFGLLGILISFLFGITILLAKLLGNVVVPGYAATVLTVIFFGGINSLGLGVVGAYAWRTYENTKQRPLAVVTRMKVFGRTGNID